MRFKRVLSSGFIASTLLFGACSTTSQPAPADGGAASPSTPPSTQSKKEAKAEARADARAEKEADMIEGTPAPNSKFNRLRIGMGMREVMDTIGAPTDQGAYITGKAFIPFYYGRDTYRHEFLYKGLGRLVFAGGSRYSFQSGRLIRVIHNADERGYR